MKNIYFIIIACLISWAFTSCEEREFIFPDDMAYAAFKTPDNSNSLELEKSENTTSIVEIPVAVAAHKGDAVTVNFEFSTEGIDNPAIEGVDFELVNTSKTLTFANRVGVENIQIRVIDNSIVDFTKEIKILLTEATVSFGLEEGNTEFSLRITDDEDPLAPYKGSWMVEGQALMADEHPTDITKLLINDLFIPYAGLCTNLSVIAELDFDANTVTFPSNTPCGIYGADFGDNEGTNVVVCARDINTGAWLPDELIVGHVQEDGSILFSTHIGFTDDGLSGGAWWQGYMHWTRP